MAQVVETEATAATAADVAATTPSGKPDASVHHLAFIDSIRALAALYVAVCHAWYEPSNGYYSSRFINKLGLSYGHLAVDVFIVVSGFCLMLPTARRGDILRSAPEFYARRVRRIVPPYWMALLLGLAINLLVTTKSDGTAWAIATLPVSWPRVASIFLLVPDLFPSLPGGVVNYPLWTITTEFQIYLFFPLIVLSLRRLGAWPTFAIALAVGMAIRFGFPMVGKQYAPWYLALFTAGAIAARAVAQNRRPQSGKMLWAAYAALAVVVAAIIKLKKDGFYNLDYLPLWDVLVGVAAAIALYHLSFDTVERKGRLMRFLLWTPLPAIGLFSYSLYLVHAPLLHLLGKLYTHLGVASDAMRFGLLVVSLPLVVGGAYLFFLAFERPFLTARAPAKTAKPETAKTA